MKQWAWYWISYHAVGLGMHLQSHKNACGPSEGRYCKASSHLCYLNNLPTLQGMIQHAGVGACPLASYELNDVGLSTGWSGNATFELGTSPYTCSIRLQFVRSCWTLCIHQSAQSLKTCTVSGSYVTCLHAGGCGPLLIDSHWCIISIKDILPYFSWLLRLIRLITPVNQHWLTRTSWIMNGS